MSETKYFVAYTLKGEVAQYHARVREFLSKKFSTTFPFAKAPPHITIKAPFVASSVELAGLEHTLGSFAESNTPVPLEVSGFGRFGYRTVYLNAHHTVEAIALVRSCIKNLNTLRWMPREVREGKTLHVSVAQFLTPRQSRHIWHTVRKMEPHFMCSLNSLSILEKLPNERMWHVRREFQLGEASPVLSSITRDDFVSLET